MRGSTAQSNTEKPVRGKLITTTEAAEYTGIGKTTLYDMARKCQIRFFSPPRGKIHFDTADLDDYLRLWEVPAGTVSGGN